MITQAQAQRKTGALALVGAVALPLVVGGVSALLTSDAMAQFGRLNQPPLSPPGWLFPVAWTILYALMGLASYRIYAHPVVTDGERQGRRIALVLYGVQLFFNFCWSLFFFGGGFYLFSFVWLMLLWALVVALVAVTLRFERTAAYLLVPYVAWLTFAAYLNLSITILN